MNLVDSFTGNFSLDFIDSFQFLNQYRSQVAAAPMHPPASAAATQKSCDIGKVRFFREYCYIVIFSSL